MFMNDDIVEAEVTNVEVYGIFCRYESKEMLITIPETSWIASYCSCKQFAEPSDKLTVRIIHIDAESEKITATIKGLYSNPWQTNQFNVGTKHLARVIRYVEKSDRCNDLPAYLLELFPGSYVMLPANGHATRR